MLILVRSLSRSLDFINLVPITFFPNWRLSHSLHGNYSILIVLLAVFLWTFSTSVHFEMGEVPELRMIIKLQTNSDFFFFLIPLSNMAFFPLSFPFWKAIIELVFLWNNHNQSISFMRGNDQLESSWFRIVFLRVCIYLLLNFYIEFCLLA